MAATAVPRTSRARRVTPAGLGRFLGRRLGIGVILIIGVTLVAFILTHLIPADPAAANLGQGALGDPAIVKAFYHEYGLDKPLVDQYLIYLWKLLHGNLGISEHSHMPVSSDLRTVLSGHDRTGPICHCYFDRRRCHRSACSRQ